jgi:hypothetical protein
MAVLQIFYYIMLLARLLMKLTMSVSRKTCISAILYVCWWICKFNITNNKKENTRVVEGNHVCSVEEQEGPKLNYLPEPEP